MYKDPKNFVPDFFNDTAESYDKIVKYCTFGKDDFWKAEILKQIPTADLFLDLACGTGILTRKIAEKFPKSKVVGVDITASYIEKAKKNSLFNKNITYLIQDAEKLDLSEQFDCITASYLPKYCNPKVLVEKCSQHLKSNGKVIFHDFIYPKNKFIRTLWDFYFVILNFVSFLIPSWKEAFLNLPKVIRYSKWPTTYEYEMKKNGFDVKYFPLTFNTSAILIGKKL